jgi:hypothetical protein
MEYTLRAPRPTALLPLLAVPVAIAFSELVGLPGFPLLFLVAFAAVVLYGAWQRSLVLKVDGQGVQLGRGVRYEYGSPQAMVTRVPWSSIRDVVVVSAGPFGGDRGTEVGVRLQPGAPLPAGARAIVSDPRNPDAVQPDMRTRVTDRFDRGRLEAAVAAHGGRVIEINQG